MDMIIQWAEACSVRLHAGALGSLIGLIAMPADVGYMKQFVCSWCLAVFGTPVALAICKSTDLTERVIGNMTEQDAESAGAFLTGMIGWSLMTWIHKQAKLISKGRWKKPW